SSSRASWAFLGPKKYQPKTPVRRTAAAITRISNPVISHLRLKHLCRGAQIRRVPPGGMSNPRQRRNEHVGRDHEDLMKAAGGGRWTVGLAARAPVGRPTHLHQIFI